MNTKKIGRFYVRYGFKPEQSFEGLRAAQEGCAVLRCESLDYMRAYEVVAHHPDFDEIDEGLEAPTYDVIMGNRDGKPVRVEFVKKAGA